MTSLPPVTKSDVGSPRAGSGSTRAGVGSPKAGGGSPSGDHTHQQHVTERLFKGPRTRARVKKTANDALVSSLSSDTLKWVKKRRSVDSQQKVVLSYHREKQLRTIFEGIDVNGHGFIDLADITEAVEYVKQKLKGIKGMEQFQNIQEIFSSMDEDGDGTVDFQEFTTAMTGSSKSVMDSASEYNIEKMYLAFIEFGTMKFRKYAIENIKEYTGKEFASDAQYDEINIKTMKEAQEQAGNNNSYDLFKSLFGHGEGMVSDQTEEQRLATKRAKQINADRVESILDDFRKLSVKQAAHDGKKHYNPDTKKEKEYEEIEERLKNGRKSNLAFRLTDPDAIVQDQYLDLQKKLSKSNDLRLHRPKSAGVFNNGTGSGKARKSVDGRTPEEMKRDAEARRSIPQTIPVKIEQQARLAARRDANEAWKSSSGARKARLSFMAESLAARNSKLAGGLGHVGSETNAKSSSDLASLHSQKSHSSIGSMQSWKSSHSQQPMGLKAASRASFPNATSMVGGASTGSILTRNSKS